MLVKLWWAIQSSSGDEKDNKMLKIYVKHLSKIISWKVSVEKKNHF